MKQAVVLVHGMGEQIPMETLEGFIETAWTRDKALISDGKKDPVTGAERTTNASWGKPDLRNRSYEVRRVTTETSRDGNSTDFYEFYWAHLMHGNTWEHVQGWITGLLLRNPFTRVPPRVRLAWVLLWIIALVVLAVFVRSLLPGSGEDPKPWVAVLSGFAALGAAAFVSNILVKRFGDVARYVSAKPSNVARRQEIREKGIELLETLIASKKNGKPEYDRIIVVAHSLGTIVAYDILTYLFARKKKTFSNVKPQPERHALEELIRIGAGLPTADPQDETDPVKFDIARYQAGQHSALQEALAEGAEWPITDFVTLGSPLTHAEFLMAKSEEDLRDKQERRILPTCPPTLEYDLKTELHHFTYRTSADATAPRMPNHAALFAYTRWTNLYSDHRAIIWGDIISGPLAKVFGLAGHKKDVGGIRDISVLPQLDASGEPVSGMKRLFFTHNSYWNLERNSEEYRPDVPQHIEELRDALKILRE